MMHGQSIRWRQRVVLAIAVGMVSGAAVGVGLGSLGGAQGHAQSEILVSPDPALLNDGQPLNSDAAQRFIQNEVLVIGSDAFTNEVRDAVGGGGGSLDVTQVALTDVVRISVTADSPTLARELAETAATRYAADRQRENAARYSAAVKGVSDRAAALERQINASPSSSSPAASARLQALTAQYQQLLDQESQLRLSEDQVTPVSIVRPGTVVPGGGASPVKIVFFVVLGALAGFGFVVLRRRRGRVLYNAGDLGDLAAPITTMLPNLAPRWRRPGARRRLTATADRAVRVHLAAIAAADVGVIAVIGAVPGVGASFVAGRLATAVVQRGNKVRVVDAPPLSSSGEAIRLAAGADVVIVVAALGVTTYDETQSALLELATGGVKPSGIVLNDRPRHPRGLSVRPGRSTDDSRAARPAPVKSADGNGFEWAQNADKTGPAQGRAERVNELLGGGA